MFTEQEEKEVREMLAWYQGMRKVGLPLIVPDRPIPLALYDLEKPVGLMPVINPVGEFEIYKRDIAAWQEAFPGVDVLQQLKECKQWLVDNPRLQKTRRGIRRFINAWLSREQDKAGVYGRTAPTSGGMSLQEKRKRGLL
jgi:hypothetical protein